MDLSSKERPLMKETSVDEKTRSSQWAGEARKDGNHYRMLSLASSNVAPSPDGALPSPTQTIPLWSLSMYLLASR